MGFTGMRHQKLDAPANTEIFIRSPTLNEPTSWSHDGRLLIYSSFDAVTLGDIWVLPNSGGKPGTPYPFLRTEFNEREGRLSPGDQWMAYASNETGQFEVYVQSFPDRGGKTRVSNGGGSQPMWSRDGKELFYIAADRKLMAVDVKTSPKFAAGAPKALFETHTRGATAGHSVAGFEISPDGKRFLLINMPEAAPLAPMTLILNWTAGLKN